ncbi:MAG: UbiA family prenyltransferase [Phycisphaerales bacterium]|nr:UbiA family prenyltransferase [Phycisphaerales bacterium]
MLILTMDLLADRSIDWRACLFVGLCAHGCYLLDRVKASDNRLDPADALAQPARFSFLSKHATLLRLLIVLGFMLNTAVGGWISPWLIPIPPLALGCVFFYAGRPPLADRPRIKDLPAVKAILIAGAHTALATATTLATIGTLEPIRSPAVLIPLAIIGTLVFADAILCDLDDHDADRAYNTQSIPVLLGRSPAWRLSMLAHLIAICTLMIHDRFTIGSLGFGFGIVATNLAFMRLRRQRDAVDARLLPLALLLVTLR